MQAARPFKRLRGADLGSVPSTKVPGVSGDCTVSQSVQQIEGHPRVALKIMFESKKLLVAGCSSVMDAKSYAYACHGVPPKYQLFLTHELRVLIDEELLNHEELTNGEVLVFSTEPACYSSW